MGLYQCLPNSMIYTIVAYIHNVNVRTIGKVTIWYKVREKKRNQWIFHALFRCVVDRICQ